MNTAETLISERTVDLTGKTSEGYTASQRPSLRDSVEIAVNNGVRAIRQAKVTK